MEEKGEGCSPRVGHAYDSTDMGYVTGISEELNENVPKLKQKRQVLQLKTELLNKLDEEIVELVEEEGLDREIEQADIVREANRSCY